MKTFLLCIICAVSGVAAPAAMIDVAAVSVTDGLPVVVPDNTRPQETVPVDAMPKLLSRADPVYPREALQQGIEGKVYVQVLVDRNGTVAEVVVLKSDAEILNQAALDAARKFKFAPAMKDKSPVAAKVVIPFQFRVSDKGTDRPGSDRYGLFDMVKNLLEGPVDSAALACVDPAASLVLRNKLLNLRKELLSGESLREKGIRPVFQQLLAEEPSQGATLFLITEGKSKRYHTVTFTRASDQKWHIRLWHVSE